MPAAHASQLKKTYAQAAHTYHQKHLSDVDYRADEFLKLLPAHSHILDFGAGTGRDSRYFVNKGFHTTLIDISAEMLDYARKQIPSSSEFIEADMTEVALKPNSFDAIWSNASLLHLTKHETKKVLKKLFSALKKNGILFVRVKEGSGEKMQTDTQYSSSDQPLTRFFSYYTEKEMSNFIQKAGFKVLKTESYQATTNPHRWIVIFAQKP